MFSLELHDYFLGEAYEQGYRAGMVSIMDLFKDKKCFIGGVPLEGSSYNVINDNTFICDKDNAFIVIDKCSKDNLIMNNLHISYSIPERRGKL